VIVHHSPNETNKPVRLKLSRKPDERAGCERANPLCAFFLAARLRLVHAYVLDFGDRSTSHMKAKIIITPKKAVLDPQGKTVQNALAHMGYTGIGAVHVGKYLEVELTAPDKETARKQIDEACHKILSNPVIEDYRFELEG
jgi:phosphoribosylformylglycinamidine synthase